MKKYYRLLPLFVLLFVAPLLSAAQKPLDSLLPVRGLAIAAPAPGNVDSFITFMNTELPSRKVNTLILRVDYGYQFTSHPELADSNALSAADVKKLVQAAKKNSKLLAVYPQFDETPWVKMPAEYKWPNADSLYCKSYCPLHPGVHKVAFDVVDEVCTVFEADAFHAGMDEVFYIGDDKCPRCGGMDKAELFAGEVRKVRDHLAEQRRELWIWADRLLDGKATGLGMWEASFNNTHRAIDIIPKDIVLCDWHYARPDKTAVYFAMKGFKVVTCSWRNADVAVAQVNDIYTFRQQSTIQMKGRFYGVMETIWSGASSFFDDYYGKKLMPQNATNISTQENCFRQMFEQVKKLSQ